MKVLHLTDTDIRSDSRILKEMQSIAKNNKYYSVEGIGIDRDENRKSKNLENIVVYSLKIKSRKWKLLPDVIRHLCTLVEFYIKIFIMGLSKKPDIVHCHDILVLPIGVLLKIFNKSKIIYDAHELESERNGHSRFKSLIIKFTEKILWKYIDNLIIVSPSIEVWYNNYIGEKRSKIIMNAPILERDNKDYNKQYLRKKFTINAESKIFIYVGGFMKGRGIEILLDIFKSKDINSHIVFLGYGVLEDEIIESSMKNSNIHLHKAVAHEEVIGVVKSANIGLCFIQNISLSDYYCLPNKLFEYVFSGIPVLASNFPDIKDVVTTYGLGECAEMKKELIFEMIKKFEDKENIFKININNLYNLSWQKQEEKLYELYSELETEIKVKGH